MPGVYTIHIAAGAVALIAGYVALYSSKGASLHRRAGMVFVYAMLTMVVPPGNAPHYGKLLDLEMLVLTPRGRERTKTEFSTLLRGAGFQLRRVIATGSPLSIVEAIKA